MEYKVDTSPAMLGALQVQVAFANLDRAALLAELTRVTAERDRALQTIALLQEQRDFWKDEGMRGFEPESAEECD